MRRMSVSPVRGPEHAIALARSVGGLPPHGAVVFLCGAAGPRAVAVGLADDFESTEVDVALKELVGLAGVADVLLVRGRRWWSLTCKNSTCCPPEGRELGSGCSCCT